MKIHHGFTLVELMIVTTIIGVLASVSMPAYRNYVQRSEVVDAFSMASALKGNVTDYYMETLDFPLNNRSAGVPEPEQLIGNRISQVEIESGAIHITLGHKASQPLQGKVLTFRPAVVSGSPLSPIAWLCGYDEPVAGMEAIGTNRTTLDDKFLSYACRGPRSE